MKKLIRGALAGFLSVAMLVTPSTVSNAAGGDATFTEAVLNDDWTVTVNGINWNNAYETNDIPYIGLSAYDQNHFNGQSPIIYKPEEGNGSSCTSEPITSLENFKYHFDETGTYTFYVQMHENIPPEEPNSCSQMITGTYTRPGAEMDAPTNVQWDGYILKWDGNPNDRYYVFCDLVYPDNRKGSMGTFINKGATSRDFSREVVANSGVIALKASVMKISDTDVRNKANSEKVSAPTLVIKSSEELLDQLDMVSTDSPEGIMDIFDTPAKMGTLMVGMTKDTAVAQKVKDIEDAYVGANGITRESTDVTQEVQDMGIEPSSVSIVGAGLNANVSDTVTLKISKSSGVLTSSNKWKNIVGLDIKLVVSSNNKTNLDVPVTITMPLPNGVEKDGLVIHHIHSNGDEDDISAIRYNSDGTITFSVIDFSTFIFANSVDQSGVTQENRDNQKRTTYRTPVENAINQAVATGGTAEISGITALSYDEMKKLSKNPDAKLVMHYTYNGEKYKVIVTGKDAVVDPSIPWYGPLYLVGKYGNSITTGK